MQALKKASYYGYEPTREAAFKNNASTYAASTGALMQRPIGGSTMCYFRLAVLVSSALIFASAGSVTANAQREGGAFFGPFATGNSSGGNFGPGPYCGNVPCGWLKPATKKPRKPKR